MANQVSPQVLNWLRSVVTSEYHDATRTYSDVTQILAYHPGFSLRTDVYTFENGASTLLLNVQGTLPVSFRGNSYGFPISLWIPREYPSTPPSSFVTPTKGMAIRPGQHVSADGRIYHPYLAGWASTRSNILEFVSVLQDIFAREPPLIAREMPQARPVPAPAPQHDSIPPPVPPLPPEFGKLDGGSQSLSYGNPAPPPKPSLDRNRTSSRYDMPLPLPPPAQRSSPRHDVQEPCANGHIPPSPSMFQYATYKTNQYMEKDESRHARQVERDWQLPREPSSPLSQNTAQFQPLPYPSTIIHPPNPLHPPQHQRKLDPLPNQPRLEGAASYYARQAQYSQTTQHQDHQAYSPRATQLHNPKPPEDLLTSPFENTLPPQPNYIAPPPIPPNPQKDALLSALSKTLTQQIQSTHKSNVSAIAPLQAQQAALTSTLNAVNKEISQLNDMEVMLSSNESILHQAMRDADKTLENTKRRNVPNVDDVLVAPTVVAGQLYQTVAEEKAIEDCRALLGKALDKGRLGSVVWAKLLLKVEKPQSAIPVRNSILTLEKSTELWPAQIAKASHILDIDLVAAWAKLFEGGVTARSSEEFIAVDPRIDWTLKWLLKRLVPEGGHPSRQCHEFNSWVLLYELIIRCPTSTVARVLKTFRYVYTLESIFRCLRESIVRKLVKQKQCNGSGSEFEASSSDTLVISEKSTPKKRKRDGSEVLQAAPYPTHYAVDKLFSAICGAVHHIIQLTQRHPERSPNYAVEHMKDALRAPPEVLANILGDAFFMATHFMQTPLYRPRQRNSSMLELAKGLEAINYTSCLTPMIKLWDLQLSSPRNLSVHLSQHAYLYNCTVPSLQLLQTGKEDPSCAAEKDTLMKHVERLLIDHVILPSHASFLSGFGSSEVEDEHLQLGLSDALISALEGPILEPKASDSRANQNTQEHMKMTLLSLLFGLAIKARPRHLQKLRQIEDPWLEHLFCELDKCAAALLVPNTVSNIHKEHISLLTWLLERCFNAQVMLGSDVLGGVIEKSSGLWERPNGLQIEWQLLGLCLSIDPKLFVLPSPSPNVEHKVVYRQPKKFLIALLGALTTYQPRNGEEKQQVLHEVLLPLLSGFAAAHEFPAFIEHWKEQLSRIQAKDPSTYHGGGISRSHYCIWEDDALLAAASTWIDSLTAPQIHKILLETLKYLDANLSDPLKTQVLPLQVLAVTECVLRGLAKEDTIDRLADDAQSIFALLGDVVERQATLSEEHRWRIWRTMTAIVQRWPPSHTHARIRKSAQPAICHASELINRTPDWQPSQTMADYTESYHAFTFVLSHGWLSDHFWHKETFSSFQLALGAVRKILDIMKPFCEEVQQQRWETLQSQEEYHEAFIPGVRLGTDIVPQLIEQAYFCALYRHRSSLRNLDEVDFSWPWYRLTSNRFWLRNIDNMKLLQTFLVRRYLQVSYFDDSKYLNVQSTDYTWAFQCLLNLSVGELRRESRINLANRVSHILLGANMVNLANVTSHLVLLERLIEQPSSSMEILNNKHNLITKTSQQKHGNDIALLDVAGTIDDFHQWSTDNVECVEALKHVTRHVISYLFSTLDRHDTIKYLRDLYSLLVLVLKHNYSNGKACGSAFSTVATMTLSFLHQHYDKLPPPLRDDLSSLATTRQFNLECLLSVLRLTVPLPDVPLHHLSTSEWGHNLGVTIECIVEFTDLLPIHLDWAGVDEYSGPLGNLSRRFREPCVQDILADLASRDDASNFEYASVRLARLDLALCEGDDGLLRCLEEVSSMLHSLNTSEAPFEVQDAKGRRLALQSAETRNYLLHYIQDALLTLGCQRKAKLLASFLAGGAEDNLNEGILLILRALVLSVKNDEVEELRPLLSELFTSLCRNLWQSSDLRRPMLSMHCISVLLQRKPRAITQWHMDNLLASITIASSRLQSRTTEKHSAMLYTGLCRHFLEILRVHRAKIGGRYHLVLPALQSLLRCLFTVYSTSTLDPEPISALGEQQAAEYSRILTTLCDPTVSSVGRSRTGSNVVLNDEIKKARSIAGQYLPYLIMEFCRYQLKGRLKPEMRKALNAGLWAALEVMSQDAMRTMNAAMDSSTRSVFKALYDDFKRVGKWNGG
ncbi:MAG: hypothetical protein Q9163_004287 [Psora crenata]